MTKKWILGVGAVAVAAAVCCAPAVTNAGDNREEKKAAKEGEQYFDGDISAVDFKAGTVTVKEKAGSMTFTCDSATKFYAKHKKEAAKLEDFKVGDKVEVRYVVVAGTPTCKRLAEAGSRADKKEKKEEKAEKKK